MKKVHLGENGPEVSQVIYSFWRAMEDPDGVAYGTIKSKLLACLKLGITTFDHADIYGDYQVEKLFGKALKEIDVKREEIVISTKCGKRRRVRHPCAGLSESARLHQCSRPEHTMPTPPHPASRPAPDRYAAERYKPTSPNCARSLLALQFDGQTLRATGTRRALVLPAVSGRAVDGRFDYSTDRQRVADQGPIPTGDYWIQPQELQSNAWYRLRNPRAAWGRIIGS